MGILHGFVHWGHLWGSSMEILVGILNGNPLRDVVCWNLLRGSFLGILYGDVRKDPLGNPVRGSFLGALYAALLWWSPKGILYENPL